MLSTSQGVMVEVEHGDEPLFVGVQDLQNLALDYPPRDMNGINELHEELRGLACLDKSVDPPSTKASPTFSAVAEQMLCDCLLDAINVLPSKTTKGFTLSLM